MKGNWWKACICGGAAGIANGIFGAGGGMLLVPLLHKLKLVEEDALFSSALGIMLPISAVTFGICYLTTHPDLSGALPCCIGGIAGGLAAGLLYQRIPVKWLHRALGIMILWGGLRMLL